MNTSSSPIWSPTTTSSSGAAPGAPITLRPCRADPHGGPSTAWSPSVAASVGDEQHHLVGGGRRRVEQPVELLDHGHQLLHVAEAAGVEAPQPGQGGRHVVLAEPTPAAGGEQRR